MLNYKLEVSFNVKRRMMAQERLQFFRFRD